METPKILFKRGKIAFALVCFLLASYMTITQIVRYLENRDASTIAYKKLNQTPRDRYPTFSICFRGADIFWNQRRFLFDTFGITSSQYVQLLKGDGFKYEYDIVTRLYRKELMTMNNVSIKDFKKVLLHPSDIFVGTEFVTLPNFHVSQLDDRIYGSEGKEVTQGSFHIGYQSLDEVCFTRNSTDELNTIRDYDLLSLKRSLLKFGIHLSIQLRIVVHYPGQLIRSLSSPKFESTLGYYAKNKLLELKISHVTILRKRPDSNERCNEKDQDDDLKLHRLIVKRIGCIPIYLKNLEIGNTELKICNKPRELKTAFDQIMNYKRVMSTYDPPCVEMTNLVQFTRNVVQLKSDFLIKISYTEDFYQEIENVRDFSFETFWSSVGGFLGIFLGYSVLQIPDLLSYLSSFLMKINCLSRQTE